MNGPDVAEHARRLKPNIAVIYASGYPDFSRQAGTSIEVDAILLNKPYSATELAIAVSNSLKKVKLDGIVRQLSA